MTCRQKYRRQCNERGEGPVSMSKKTDVQSPGYRDPTVSTPSPSLPSTHTLQPPTYLWNVLREAPVCFHCKHLNIGSGELSQDRWAEKGQRSLAEFQFPELTVSCRHGAKKYELCTLLLMVSDRVSLVLVGYNACKLFSKSTSLTNSNPKG